MYSIEEVRMTDPEIAAAIEKEIKRPARLLWLRWEVL